MDMFGYDNDVYIEKVNKWYPGDVHAVKDVDMQIREGEFLVFVGPSGCGKTTLLRMIAGLEQISDGTIRMGERIINKVPPKNRDIAMVFQNYALYPTMSVFDNIAFPLQMRKMKKKEIRVCVTHVAQKLDLEEYLERRPGALSGGQRQRVALARAMVRQPRLFLMDEPLSNLDAKLRVNMRREIVTLQRDLGVMTVYVTHDQTEAMTMGTRIAVMKDGVLQQIGTPQEIYQQPKNLFTALFIGSPPMNTWDGEVWADNGCTYLSLGSLSIRINGIVPDNAFNRSLTIGIRPEYVSLSQSNQTIRTQITSIENTGRETMVFMSTPDLPPLTMAAGSEFKGEIGDFISIAIKSDKLHFFGRETGERIRK